METVKKPSKKKVIFMSVLVVLAAAIIFTGFYINFFFNKISAPDVTKAPPEPENKLNVLVIGVAKGLSDTLLLCSYDPKTNGVTMLSIPRDTYYPRSGYKHPAQKKINAAYGSEGAEGAVRSVAGLTGVPINYYVKIDYNVVEQVVDAIGGVPVTVQAHMNYDDPADDLHIHFDKGTVVEKGEDIVRILRWRKNNGGKGGYAEGDLGRIKTQHEVIQLGLEKVLNGNIAMNIVKLQGPIMNNIKTDMPASQIVFYLSKLNNIKSGNITIETLPGEAKMIDGLSFYVPDEVKLSELTRPMKEEPYAATSP